MRRLNVSRVSLVCCLGVSGFALAAFAQPVLAQKSVAPAAKPTIIKVTAGKPSELGFKLSKISQIPAGKITFQVTNLGVISHDFKVCTVPVKNSSKNTCTGKGTKMLKHGQSATLVLTLTKHGLYEYLCTVPGHANAGMKGTFGVAVAATAPKPTSTPTTTAATTTKPTTTTTPVSTTCANPVATTVKVNEFDFGFTLTPATVPCGTVTFNQVNTGQANHNFDLNTIGGGAGGFIDPGQTTTMTVTLKPGSYPFVCDVPGHAMLGMSGTLTVTG